MGVRVRVCSSHGHGTPTIASHRQARPHVSIASVAAVTMSGSWIDIPCHSKDTGSVSRKHPTQQWRLYPISGGHAQLILCCHHFWSGRLARQCLCTVFQKWLRTRLGGGAVLLQWL